MDKVLWFYAPGDFHDMAGMGVNAVRIPVPCWAFNDDVVINGDFRRMVSRLLDRADGLGLKAFLVLMGGRGRTFWGWDCLWRNAGRPSRPKTMTTTTNATTPPRDAPSPVDLLDLLRLDLLALFLVVDALSSTLMSTATGRGRPDDAPSLLLSYDYYVVSILARLPPKELGVVDGGKDDGGNKDDDARGASVAVRNLGI